MRKEGQIMGDKKNRGRSYVGGNSSRKIANTRQLTRIMMILEFTKEKMTYTELRCATGINNHLSDALNFLVNNGLIKMEKRNQSAKVYYK